MALISPGVEVTVIDESQYQPTAVGTIPYVLLATEENKTNPSGSLATGTIKGNAEQLIPVSGQRELVSLFGTPKFQLDASGNPINASELNEYGLLSAYSALGVASRVYVQRADVDLAQLEGSSIRPTGNPVDGTYWLDLTETEWGIFEWTGSQGFTSPGSDFIVVSDSSNVVNSAPVSSIGAIDSYAVVTTSSSNPVYYKDYTNTWQLLGSDGWMKAVPTAVGSIANPSDLAQNDQLIINTTNVAITGSTPTVTSVASDINSAGITGVTATVSSVGQLELRIDSTSESDGATADGQLAIAAGTPDAVAKLGLTTGTFAGPAVQFSDYRNVPAWRSSDTTPRPFGSVWIKTSATGNGANWAVKEYNANLDSWVLQAAPLYANDNAAVYGLDPVGGGAQIDVGSLYVRYDVNANNTVTFKPYIKNVVSILKITGSIPTSPFVFTQSDEFDMEVSVPGSETAVSATITLSGTTATSLVADILSADLPNITAVVESTGAISISHLAGGTIKFTQTTGTPLDTAGLLDHPNVQEVTTNTVFLASPFVALTYTFSNVAPFTNPEDGTLWYYNNPLEVDILINDGSDWKGYKTVSNDARGYDLSATDPQGPILAATRPTTQVNGAQLVPGDLWIDTSDLENYPVIYRYTDSNVWELIDNTDDVSVDGIVFGDARWATSETVDPIVDELPSIVALQSSNYLDSDAPDYRLYPRGALLFNTRRSGFNVKRFESTWFDGVDNEPVEVAAWVSQSGVDADGIPYFGSRAQRNVVVEAMKSAIESSTALREEQVQFNLIAAPGYPELIQNMITLNNDRKQTAFIIGDSPLTLSSGTASIETWASNSNLAQDNSVDGLVSRSEYLGVFYPSGLATNLDGESVVVPPSHMMLRTMIRSDNVSYPWFAPAGVRRGLIDNVSSIGFVDQTDNNLFRSIGVTNSLRDVLYEQDVNPLTVLPGVGLVNYGQKTRAPANSALDRINVARLVAYLRVVLDQVARPFIFEPNDTITRNQVKAGFESALNDLVAKRGIYDYLVVCDTSNNTPDRIDRNELWVDIAIEPVKAIEFIYIPVRLKNTGDIEAGL